MDDLQKLLEQFSDLVKEHLVTLADENGNLDIKTDDLGLVFVSTAMGLAARWGASRENLHQVSKECIGLLKEDEDKKSKIILS